MKDGKYVILCVDDDDDILESMQIVLEGNDYIMEAASSGEEGLKKYKQCDPDLIIVDLMMEEVDAGTNLVKNLLLAGNKAPVFMLSSLGDQLEVSVDHAELGLSGVFQKPLQIDSLLGTLKASLG